MLSERARRRIEQLLDEADQAIGQEDWELVRKNMRTVLTLDPENTDAHSYLAAAERGLAPGGGDPAGTASVSAAATERSADSVARRDTPSSFVNGRYAVVRFLGEGGKKRV